MKFLWILIHLSDNNHGGKGLIFTDIKLTRKLEIDEAKSNSNDKSTSTLYIYIYINEVYRKKDVQQ